VSDNFLPSSSTLITNVLFVVATAYLVEPTIALWWRKLC
jgi:hypothetical protein